jgi:hypothetical protein
MNKRIDYTELAAKLDYAALDRKLTQLADRKPPKQRKTVADVLEPLRERLLALHHKGWSSGQLAVELKAAGVLASPARLRECLNRWASGATKSPTRRRRSRVMMDPRPATAVPAPTRIRTSGEDSQPKLGLS